MKHTALLATSLLVLSACVSSVPEKTNRTPAGNPNGLVTLVEFADLQCPACRAAHTGVMKPILEAYGTRIRYEFKHFPLQSIHPNALIAGQAAECAADQGKFWEYVDHVYTHQEDLTADVLPEWAEALGLDVNTFETCLDSHRKRGTVLADYKEGRDLGVTGTPTFFLDGERVEAGFDTLSAAIDARLKQFEQRL
jgi:protein-disulfide isomerase